MIWKNLVIAAMAAAIAMLVGCAAAKVSQVVEVPARQSGMVDSRKLAVFYFNGDIDGTITAQVESYLSNINVRGTPYFKVLEREMLDKIMDEQRMVSSSGYFDENDAVKLGKLSGADTLIMGSVSKPPISVRYYRKAVDYCLDKKCTKKETRYKSCADMVTNIDLTLKAVSVQQGTIIFTQTYAGKASDTDCGGAGGKNETDLRNQAIKQILNDLRKDVAPYSVMLSIEFMDKDDSMSPATKAKLEGAMEYIRQKRVDRACEIFRDALAGDTNSPALYYNLGVCAEIEGDLDKAEDLYHQSDRKAAKPIRLISEAINRVKAMKSNQTELGKQIH
ncbi:MAG: CsgG/HfaB family protein [Pseudomonadota bacterium]